MKKYLFIILMLIVFITGCSTKSDTSNETVVNQAEINKRKAAQAQTTSTTIIINNDNNIY